MEIRELLDKDRRPPVSPMFGARKCPIAAIIWFRHGFATARGISPLSAPGFPARQALQRFYRRPAL